MCALYLALKRAIAQIQQYLKFVYTECIHTISLIKYMIELYIHI